MIKHFFDVVLALLLMLLLWPVFLLVYVWVRIDSSGPGLFLQDRVGRGGRMFRIVKFRTMHAGASTGLGVTMANDSRVTRAGRRLREIRLDELPQLYNVLVGDMSFVGPRPEIPRYVECYPQELRLKIQSVRPGLTDPATLKYRMEAQLLSTYADPEAAYRNVILPDKVRIYAEYVDNRSLAGDLQLLYRTVCAVLFARNEH